MATQLMQRRACLRTGFIHIFGVFVHFFGRFLFIPLYSRHEILYCCLYGVVYFYFSVSPMLCFQLVRLTIYLISLYRHFKDTDFVW